MNDPFIGTNKAEACIEWINEIEQVDQVNNLSDFTDGIALYNILVDIDRPSFQFNFQATTGDNWVFKFNVLKKIYKKIERYYLDVLEVPFYRFPKIDLNAIAKTSDDKEILKLVGLVIYITCLCPKNKTYIQKIQQLKNPHQQALMDIISYLSKLAEENRESSHTPRSSYADDDMLYGQSESSRIAKEMEELESNYKTLIDQNSELVGQYEILKDDKKKLEIRLSEMEIAISGAKETGKDEALMRTKYVHLTQDLEKARSTNEDHQARLKEQENQITDLTRKNESLARNAEDAVRLKDQLYEYRHVAEKLQKAENVIEKYKKKLEDSADLRKQIEKWKTEHNQLQEERDEALKAKRELIGLKVLWDHHKENADKLQTENIAFKTENNKLNHMLTLSAKKVQTLEEEKGKYLAQVQSLEDHLQESQLGFGTSERPKLGSLESDEVDEMDIDIDLNDSMEDSLKETNVAELKVSKRRLERELKKLKEENATDHSQKVIVLQHLLDDANRLKNQFEKNYIETAQERDILQIDMARIREGIPDSLLDRSEHTLSLRLHVNDLEKQIKSLSEVIAKLEQKIAEGKFSLSDDNNDATDVRQRYEEVEAKSKSLEEQTQNHLRDINKLLLEKDLLNSQNMEQKDLLLGKERIYSEMRATLAAFEAKDDEPLKQLNAQLQNQLSSLQEQLYELESKGKKTKEFIRQQDLLIKDMQDGFNTENYSEAVNSLKVELGLHEEENAKLQKQLRELRVQTRREQQLMLSAWYDMSRRAAKDVINTRAPNSWLGQQRKTLDSALKRR